MYGWSSSAVDPNTTQAPNPLLGACVFLMVRGFPLSDLLHYNNVTVCSADHSDLHGLACGNQRVPAFVALHNFDDLGVAGVVKSHVAPFGRDQAEAGCGCCYGTIDILRAAALAVSYGVIRISGGAAVMVLSM